jgi:HSP20 family protein
MYEAVESKETPMADADTTPAVRQEAAIKQRTPSDFFERFFGDWPRPRFFPALWSGMEGLDVLRVEEFVDGDEIVVRAEMPGIDPDKDVELTVTDHTLRIRAERREEAQSEEKGAYRSEFRYGSFSRSVPLPVGASEKDVKATYKDGILEVRVPLDEQEAEAKKVKVERG